MTAWRKQYRRQPRGLDEDRRAINIARSLQLSYRATQHKQSHREPRVHSEYAVAWLNIISLRLCVRVVREAKITTLMTTTLDLVELKRNVLYHFANNTWIS